MYRKSDYTHLAFLFIAFALIACGPKPDPAELHAPTESHTTLGDDLRDVTGVNNVPYTYHTDNAFLERAIRLIPDDTQEAISYYSNPVDVASKYDGNSGETSMDGYVIFSDYDCSINEQEPSKFIDCTVGKMGYARDMDLVHQLPPVLNIDVFRSDWTCTSICLDSEGHLVGAISIPMYHWLTANCKNGGETPGHWQCDI